MNVGKLRNLSLSRQYARGITSRGCRPGALSPLTRKSISTCLPRRPVTNPCSRQPTSSVVFSRQYAIEKGTVKPVSSVHDVEEVDAALQQMISEGSNLAETITRQNEDIQIGSELMIHAVYDSLIDLSLQLVVKLYPDGVTGLINAEDAYTSFPPGMEEYVKQVRNGLRLNGPENVHKTSFEDAVERTTRMFNLVEKAHAELGHLFGEHHETLNEKVQNMWSLLKRAEKADKFIETETENEEKDAASDKSTMTSEKKEFDTLKSKISKLVDETQRMRNDRSNLEHPQNVGEGIAWGLFGIGAAVAAGTRSRLSGSINVNESKLEHERDLQKTHKIRYDNAFARLEKVNVTLGALKSQKNSVDEHVKSLEKVVASSKKALGFVVDRKNILSRIHNDLINMTKFATRYKAHQYDERASLGFLAKGIVDVLDATPDWPGTVVPVVLTAMFLRWPPSIVLSDSDDVLGESEGGDNEAQVKLDRVVEKASLNYIKFAKAANPQPHLNDYLHDVEFDWEHTFARWRKIIEDGEFTGFRPAPAIPLRPYD
ncbi:uncharacterized protein TRUGW13939_00478 [Talaromyces rugulosus]|uniref:Uncharacterized protein n=1 Tax=Talaromyces rugulosus TaxID=121627 RepID=A0A7H8QHE7_TALRU|nr:uncharacterized protein TRUGW13939_00478 [Talaromyces rugulosus]QKX53399.1 hypothetical protein TRUGW13939_00478 [Talaromyces rugulosus]